MGVKIAFLLDHDGINDSRVLREARALQVAGHEVRIFCLDRIGHAKNRIVQGITYTPCHFDIRTALPFVKKKGRRPINTDKVNSFNEAKSAEQNKRFFFFSRLKKFVGIAYFYRAAFQAVEVQVAHFKPAVIHAHDLTMLPAGGHLARQIKTMLVYDSHELEASRNEKLHTLHHAYRMFMERKFIKKAHAVVTVSDSISRTLSGRYGIVPPTVILNTPEKGIDSDCQTVRACTNTAPDVNLGVYIGSIQQGRGIESMIDCLAEMPDLHLVVIGNGSPSYVETLRHKSNQYGQEDRFNILDPVPSEHIVSFIKNADFSLVPLQGKSDSYNFSLPNKIFESLAADLPVVTTPLFELSKFVHFYKCGIVADGFDGAALANAIRQLSEHKKPIKEAFKKKAWEAEYDWSVQSCRLLQVYDDLLSHHPVREFSLLPHSR